MTHTRILRSVQLTVSILATTALLSTFGCGKKGSDEATPQPEIRLTYSIFFPATHSQYKAAESWAQEVRERTDGRIRIQLFPGGTLTKPAQAFEGVVNGVSDIAMSCCAYTRGRFPLLEGLDLPVGYPDGVTASKAAHELVAKYQPEELSQVQVLYFHAHGPGILATKKSVEALADMDGMKVRATGLSAQVAEALGAVPVAMSQPETYEALQRGVVDGTLCPMETLKGWKQGEVISSVTDTTAIGYTTAMFVVMNKDTWAALPVDIQKIITEVSNEWVGRHGQAWDQADEEGAAFIADLGHPVHLLSDEDIAACREKVQPILNDYVTRMTEKGLDGKAFLADLQARVQAARSQKVAE